MSDWFEHWATKGVKPVFLCEYGVPFTWDWTMYRGWYKGERTFGQRQGAVGVLPGRMERAVPRRPGVSHQRGGEAQPALGGQAIPGRQALASLGLSATPLDRANSTSGKPVLAEYLTDNWRAYRTWGVSANSPWEYAAFWKLREGVDRRRKELKVDWDNLQKPGFSPDYLEPRHGQHDHGLRADGLDCRRRRRRR